MSRQHFAQRMQAGSQMAKAPKTKDEEERNMAGAVPAKSEVMLSAELIYAFQQKYLHHKYDPPLPTPAFHFEMWGIAANEAHPYALFLAPRGHAKSTSITEAYGLAALLFRLRDFAVIFSNTYQQSVEFLEDVKKELLENDELREDFGIKRLLREREDDIIVQCKDGHKFRIVARGSGQPVRGLKWNKRRPNLVIGDDLEDDEQILSQERREKFSKWFMRAVLPFGADNCLFRIVATILHFDSLAENLSKDPQWKTLRYRAHKGFNDFSEILWPEKFSVERLRSIRAKYIHKGDHDGYSQEYLNIPIAEGRGLFRKEDLLPMEKAHRGLAMRIYCAWDFAIGLKQTSDYTVGIVVGVDSLNRFFVLDVRRGRWESPEIIEEMFSVYAAYQPEVMYCEAGAIEKALGPYIYAKMRQDNIFFNIETEIPISDKVARSASWRAKTRAHQVYYDKEASWYPALEEEMLRFPKGEHDDQIDPQSLLGLKLISTPGANTQQEQAEEELIEEFGPEYFKQNSGVSPVTGY